MSACQRTNHSFCCLVVGVLPLLLMSTALHADTRSVYSLGYTPGQDAL